jgi:hypothetical protein
MGVTSRTDALVGPWAVFDLLREEGGETAVLPDELDVLEMDGMCEAVALVEAKVAIIGGVDRDKHLKAKGGVWQ